VHRSYSKPKECCFFGTLCRNVINGMKCVCRWAVSHQQWTQVITTVNYDGIKCFYWSINVFTVQCCIVARLTVLSCWQCQSNFCTVSCPWFRQLLRYFKQLVDDIFSIIQTVAHTCPWGSVVNALGRHVQ